MIELKILTMTSPLDVLRYWDFLPKRDICNFESDMENNKYHKWVKDYPDHIYAIFGAVLHLADQIQESDIIFFKSKGVDLNVSSNAYRSDTGGTTPLGTACEYRRPELATLLMKCGADPNQVDQYDFTPFESEPFTFKNILPQFLPFISST